MKDLLKNIEEFLQSGEDNLNKDRYNAAVSDFFKAIAVLCDYIIYKEIKILPKNHNERFSLLRTYFKDVCNKVSELFEVYTKSYNLRSTKEEAEKIKNYAYELKNIATSKN